MRNFKKLFFGIILVVFLSPLVCAEEPPSEEAEVYTPDFYDNYLQGFTQKLDLGTKNFLVGWTSIISEPVNAYQKNQSAKVSNTLKGFCRGVILGSVNTAGGFLNIATAVIPAFTIPLPQQGVNVPTVINPSSRQNPAV